MTGEASYGTDGNAYAIDKHLEEWEHQDEGLSNCCHAPIVEETDICSDCNEHCERIEKE